MKPRPLPGRRAEPSHTAPAPAPRSLCGFPEERGHRVHAALDATWEQRQETVSASPVGRCDSAGSHRPEARGPARCAFLGKRFLRRVVTQKRFEVAASALAPGLSPADRTRHGASRRSSPAIRPPRRGVQGRGRAGTQGGGVCTVQGPSSLQDCGLRPGRGVRGQRPAPEMPRPPTGAKFPKGEARSRQQAGPRPASSGWRAPRRLAS